MNTKEINKFLSEWPKWIAIILLFVPGILYQIEQKGLECLIYFPDFMIIVFLILSLYYSIPFIIFTFILIIGNKEFLKRDFEKVDFFMLSLLNILIYLGFSKATEIFSSQFWKGYSVLLAILILVEIKFWIKFFKRGKTKKKKSVKRK